ncbi:MAG: hypothetical protein SWH68_09140 [Thermodesulfobacteriota bacterium]|nr:hypothetical protein [Thermodesulfobacteriota bacterium]
MNPREKAKQLLMKHLPAAEEEDCGQIVDQIIEAVRQDVIDVLVEMLAVDRPDLMQDLEKQKEYEAFYTTWKQRFSQRKMTEQEFAKIFGQDNSRRLNGDLLEMVLKGAEIG